MKTKATLEQDIIKIKMRINQEFPEFYKYIDEMAIAAAENDADGVTTIDLNNYYISLSELLSSCSRTTLINKGERNTVSTFSGYTHYEPIEDIYNKGKQEYDLDPENISKKKTIVDVEIKSNEKDFQDDMSGDDLDVPGTELDDQQESVGSEDEENNYYSLGRDNHDDLEENND